MDDANLRRHVHNQVSGLAQGIVDIASIDAVGAARLNGDEHLLIMVASRVGGRTLQPIDLAGLRMLEPQAPLVLCLTARDPLLLRLSEVAIAGIDRVVVLGGPDREQDLRRDVSEALRFTLPADIDLGVRPALRDRGSADHSDW